MAERIIAVGYDQGGHRKGWRSPDLPAPAIVATPSGRGGIGYVVVERVPDNQEGDGEGG
jgi:hypothetical protein